MRHSLNCAIAQEQSPGASNGKLIRASVSPSNPIGDFTRNMRRRAPSRIWQWRLAVEWPHFAQVIEAAAAPAMHRPSAALLDQLAWLVRWSKCRRRIAQMEQGASSCKISFCPSRS